MLVQNELRLIPLHWPANGAGKHNDVGPRSRLSTMKLQPPFSPLPRFSLRGFLGGVKLQEPPFVLLSCRSQGQFGLTGVLAEQK